MTRKKKKKKEHHCIAIWIWVADAFTLDALFGRLLFYWFLWFSLNLEITMVFGGVCLFCVQDSA